MLNRVLIGFDERQQVSYTALQSSIIAQTSKPVAVIPIILRTLPITRSGVTPFTFSRFLTPWLCDFQGWGLFMDVDMLLLDDISKLFDLADERYAVMVADTKDKFERASLMLFNCAHESNRCLTPEFIEEGSGSIDLHSLGWLDEEEVGFFDSEWNHIVGIDAPNPDAKLVHYTMGTPVHPEINGCEHTAPWTDAVNIAVSSQSWSRLMGNTDWAMELSDGRVLPRLHPDARKEADEIVAELESIRALGHGAGNPSQGYTDALQRLGKAADPADWPDPFSFDAAPEARLMLPHIGPVRHLCKTMGAKTVLDYGGARQGLYGAEGIVFPDGSKARSMRAHWELDGDISFHDPRRETEQQPSDGQVDAVLCIGLLERMPVEDIVWLIEGLFTRANRFVYAVVAGRPAGETATGEGNSDASLRSKTWWELLFRTVGAGHPDVRFFVIVNRPAVTKDGRSVIQGAVIKG